MQDNYFWTNCCQFSSLNSLRLNFFLSVNVALKTVNVTWLLKELNCLSRSNTSWVDFWWYHFQLTFKVIFLFRLAPWLALRCVITLCNMLVWIGLKEENIWATATATWYPLRLPSCGRGFKFQAYTLHIFQFVLFKLEQEKDENKTKKWPQRRKHFRREIWKPDFGTFCFRERWRAWAGWASSCLLRTTSPGWTEASPSESRRLECFSGSQTPVWKSRVIFGNWGVFGAIMLQNLKLLLTVIS